METLEGMLDLGFALVRGKIRLGISYIGVGKWTYEKVQLGEKKNPKMAHSRTVVPVPVSVVSVPKCYCRFLPWVVPVPVSVVPVPKCYCHCVSVGTGTSNCGTDTTLFFSSW